MQKVLRLILTTKEKNMRTMKSHKLSGIAGGFFLLMLTASMALASSPDQPATFGTTETDLKEYLAENLEYPKSLVDEGYEVKVYVKFWVDKFGKVLNAEIHSTQLMNDTKRISEADLSLFDASALAAINVMPRWTPAVVDGKEAPVQFVLPILFKTT